MTSHGLGIRVNPRKWRECTKAQRSRDRAVLLLRTCVLCFSIAAVLYVTMASTGGESTEVNSRRHLLSHRADHDDAAGKTGALFSNIKTALPRKSLNGTELPKRFDPQNQQYLESLAIIIAGPMILSVLILLTSLGFCCGRYCCNACGGMAPRREKYTRRSRTILLVFMVIILLLCMLSATFGFWGTIKVSSSASGVFDTWIDGAVDINTDVDFIDRGLDRLVPSNTVDLTTLIDATNTTASSSRDARDLYKANDIWRQVVNFTIFTFVFFGALTGALGATSGIGGMSMCFGITSMIVLVFLWLFIAIYFLISVAIEDVCVVVNEFLVDLRNPTSATTSASNSGSSSTSNSTTTSTSTENDSILQDLLDALLECSTTGLPSADQTTSTELTRSVNQLNNLMNGWYVVTSNATNTTTPSMQALTQELNGLEETINNTPDGQVPNRAAVLVQISRVRDLAEIQVRINGLKTCEKVTNVVSDVAEQFCGNMLNAWDLVVAAMLLAGLILIPGVFVGVMGKKRFNPNNLLRPGQNRPPKSQWKAVAGASTATGAFAAAGRNNGAGGAKTKGDPKKDDTDNELTPLPPLQPKGKNEDDLSVQDVSDGDEDEDDDAPVFVQSKGSTRPDGSKVGEEKKKRRRRTRKGGEDPSSSKTGNDTAGKASSAGGSVRSPAILVGGAVVAGGAAAAGTGGKDSKEQEEKKKKKEEEEKKGKDDDDSDVSEDEDAIRRRVFEERKAMREAEKKEREERLAKKEAQRKAKKEAEEQAVPQATSEGTVVGGASRPTPLPPLQRAGAQGNAGRRRSSSSDDDVMMLQLARPGKGKGKGKGTGKGRGGAMKESGPTAVVKDSAGSVESSAAKTPAATDSKNNSNSKGNTTTTTTATPTPATNTTPSSSDKAAKSKDAIHAFQLAAARSTRPKPAARENTLDDLLSKYDFPEPDENLGTTSTSRLRYL
eukprot:TRINITY_DN398_c0_g2_i1.p1 TRINITY_DN398_c0_g2~~TRINITY_DN398_c0_g2_i1.p1  ORF type:complete len:950 (-),score=214.42 TRINITY_DN398_c0_g2_i1:79-2928(-)